MKISMTCYFFRILSDGMLMSISDEIFNLLFLKFCSFHASAKWPKESLNQKFALSVFAKIVKL